MIYVCPNCGHCLHKYLNDGLSHCSHCNQIFESSDYNRLLSAAWMVRHEDLSAQQLVEGLKLTHDEAILVRTFVGDHGYCHDEFIRLLKKLGVAQKCYIEHSA